MHINVHKCPRLLVCSYIERECAGMHKLVHSNSLIHSCVGMLGLMRQVMYMHLYVQLDTLARSYEALNQHALMQSINSIVTLCLYNLYENIVHDERNYIFFKT